nr:iron ABC transporter substrate-binding protein [Thermoleophilaceae bacterium]
MRRALTALAAAVAVLPAGCGGDDADLTVYSGRNEELIGPLMDDYEKETGLEIDVRYGDSAELAAAIAEEGDGSPADVFFSQDAGALGSIEDKLAPLPAATLDKVSPRFRDPDGRWVGVTGRSRVIAWSTARLEESEVPDSIFDVTKPEWKGKVGLAPSNASFQAFVSGMRLTIGDERTRKFLEDLAANDPKIYENNIQQIEAIDRGEVDLGLVNHYYVYELARENPGLKVRNHFLRARDPGSLVNVAGAGMLARSEHKDAALDFVNFLVSRQAQTYFVEDNGEYPLVAGVPKRRDLPALAQVRGPDIQLGDLGGKLRSTLQ